MNIIKFLSFTGNPDTIPLKICNHSKGSWPALLVCGWGREKESVISRDNIVVIAKGISEQNRFCLFSPTD